MSKVDWITWKTDVKEIIDPNVESQKLKEKVTTFITQLETHITEDLNMELSKGGLEKSYFDIMGISPANDTANKILSIVDNIKQNLNLFIEDAIKKMDEQKQVEKEQLINVIEEKLDEEKRKLENTQALQNRISPNTELISGEELTEIINVTRERINMLMEKL